MLPKHDLTCFPSIICQWFCRQSTEGIERAFNRKDTTIPFDYVINLAAETKYGQTVEVYDEKVYRVSVLAGREAAKRGVKQFVEVSTAQVYESDKVDIEVICFLRFINHFLLRLV